MPPLASMAILSVSFPLPLFTPVSGSFMIQCRWSTDDLLAGKLCFVQTDDGKITSVHHPTAENMDALNIKKAIASAFQANFKGTEEEETDTQSAHISHYR